MTPHVPSIPWLQMVEYKSNRDVETFSKFLENGGTLPEEPPAVSEPPPDPRAGDPHPGQGSPQPSLVKGTGPAGWGRGPAGGVHASLLSSPGAQDPREQHGAGGAESARDGGVPG